MRACARGVHCRACTLGLLFVMTSSFLTGVPSLLSCLFSRHLAPCAFVRRLRTTQNKINNRISGTCLSAFTFDSMLRLERSLKSYIHKQRPLTRFSSVVRRLMGNTAEQHKYINTSSGFRARYNGPPVEDMNEAQLEIRSKILESRKGTGLSGPFGPWLAIPEIAEPAQELGRACRYGTSLSFRESELVILLTGAKTRSHAEFDIHVGEALKAGIEMEVVQAIPRDENFSRASVESKLVPLLGNDREKAMARFVAELLDTYTVSDETYAATKATLDDKDTTLVEIVSIVGYYNYVAFTLNAFRIPSKEAPDASSPSKPSADGKQL